jgi:hypothetical protein
MASTNCHFPLQNAIRPQQLADMELGTNLAGTEASARISIKQLRASVLSVRFS